MRLVVTLLLAGCVVLLGPHQSASAEDCSYENGTMKMPDGSIQTIVKEVCTGDGDAAGASAEGSSGCKYQGTEIPCTKDGTVWFASKQCYAAPTGISMPWQGHTDGAVYLCMGIGASMGANMGPNDYFWVPPGQIPALVDPTALAQQALDQMSLAKPNIHLAPTPPQMTYVGLDTWLWMDQAQFTSLTNTVSAGGASVTVTAAPVRAAWDMGDGSGTTCGDAGRPWAKGMTSAERTSCSYAYNRVSDFQPGGTYTVSTSLVYQVDWTCAGPCLARTGSLGEVDGPNSTSAIRVGERQTVVTNRGGTNS